MGVPLDLATSQTRYHIDREPDVPVPLPLVSVIVGTFNHERFVVECLNSIIDGTYPNVELVIFNDASSDGSRAIIESCIRDHPEVSTIFLDHSQNIGLTKSLNEAILKSNGDFVCIISSDDVMLPNGIVDRVTYLCRHPSKLAVFADAHFIDADGRQIAESVLDRDQIVKNFLSVDELVPYCVVFHLCVAGPVFMCRRELFSEMGLYDERLYAEDMDMYLRVAARGKLGFLDNYVANYRRHEQNMSGIRSSKIVSESDSRPKRNVESVAKAAKKNLPSYGILCRIRLTSYWIFCRYLLSSRRLERWSLLFIHKSLHLVSWRMYVIKRSMIQRRGRLNQLRERDQRLALTDNSDSSVLHPTEEG
jgi:glycosyltransferase involved in cell wall biosynthesis